MTEQMLCSELATVEEKQDYSLERSLRREADCSRFLHTKINNADFFRAFLV